MLNCAILDIFTNIDELNFSYGQLINCAIVDIHKHW